MYVNSITFLKPYIDKNRNKFRTLKKCSQYSAKLLILEK